MLILKFVDLIETGFRVISIKHNTLLYLGLMEECTCILLRKEPVLELVVLNGKMGDRVIGVQKVMEGLWEVDNEKRILCMIGAKFKISVN